MAAEHSGVGTVLGSEGLGLLGEDGVILHGKKGKAVPVAELPFPVADTHGHLTSFRSMDPARAIARAALAGVGLLVVPLDPTEEAAQAATMLERLSTWQDGAADLLRRAEQEGIRCPPAIRELPDERRLPASLGILGGVHPYGAARLDEAWEALIALLEDERCLGVGEIGLDYTCDVDHGVQARAMARQLMVAQERGLPVELHLRDAADDPVGEAHADALELVDSLKITVPLELHCYTGDPAMLAPWLERGCRVAFGGAVTFKRSDEIRAAALSCPLDAMLTETDCPYMAPVPLRGCECEPAMAVVTATFLADLLQGAGRAPADEVLGHLWGNALDFLGIR